MEIKPTPINFLLLFLMIAGSAILTIAAIQTPSKDAGNEQTQIVPKYQVGDSLTKVDNTLLGGNITKISDGDYYLDSNMTVNITDADTGNWRNDTKKYIPRYSVGDHISPNGHTEYRYIIKRVDLNTQRYIVSYIKDNFESSDAISTVDTHPKVNTSYPVFKQGDYIYSDGTLEYAKILNISMENELYNTTKGNIDFMDTHFHKLDPHNPPNGLYLYKDSTTGLRFVYNEFDNRGFFVVMNMKSGEITKVEQVTRVIYRNSENSNNKGRSDADIIGAAVIGFALGVSIWVN